MTQTQISSNNKRIKVAGQLTIATGGIFLLSMFLTHSLEVLSADTYFLAQCYLLGITYALGYSMLVLCFRGEILRRRADQKQPKASRAAAQELEQADELVDAS